MANPTNRKNRKEEKDGADLFREQNFRAIRRRKMMEKGTHWMLIILAILVMAAVFVAYVIDK